jgi:hypothetical protein
MQKMASYYASLLAPSRRIQALQDRSPAKRIAEAGTATDRKRDGVQPVAGFAAPRTTC